MKKALIVVTILLWCSSAGLGQNKTYIFESTVLPALKADQELKMVHEGFCERLRELGWANKREQGGVTFTDFTRRNSCESCSYKYKNWVTVKFVLNGRISHLHETAGSSIPFTPDKLKRMGQKLANKLDKYVKGQT